MDSKLVPRPLPMSLIPLRYVDTSSCFFERHGTVHQCPRVDIGSGGAALAKLNKAPPHQDLSPLLGLRFILTEEGRYSDRHPKE